VTGSQIAGKRVHLQIAIVQVRDRLREVHEVRALADEYDLALESLAGDVKRQCTYLDR
jgi:hypothetical protein